MSSLGVYPTGTRPKGALNRAATGGPVFSILAAAGVAALAASGISEARATSSVAGVGAYTPAITALTSSVAAYSGLGSTSFNLAAQSSAVLSVSGAGTASFPQAVTASYSSTAISGVGGLLGGLWAPANASASMSGLAAFAPVLTAEVRSATAMFGDGSFGASDSPSSVATFEGNSTLAAVGYAFFLDGERACVHQELRTALVPFEDRIFRIAYENRSAEVDAAIVPSEDKLAVVSFEDRVLRIPAEPREAGSDPRKRIC